jgi:O-antigen/teichoic acid export membrane protein
MKSEILSKSISSIFLKIDGLFFSYAFYWVISRQNGAKSNGHFFIAMAVLNIAVLISLKGLNTSFLKQVSRYKKSNKQYLKWVRKYSFKYIIPVALICTIGIFSSANLIACEIFNDCNAVNSIRIISLGILPFSISSFYSEGFRGLKRIKTYELINSSLRFVFAICALLITIAFFSFKLDSTIAIVIGIIGSFIVSYYHWNKYEKEIGKNTINSEFSQEAGNIHRLSNKLFFASSASFVNNWGSTFLLGILGSSIDVGIYNIALRVSMLTKFPLLAVNSIAAPKFAEDSSLKSYQNMMRLSSKYIFYSSLPVVLIVLLFNKYILGVFGPEFVQGSNAVIILGVGQLIAALSGSVGHYLQMRDGESQYARGVTWSLLINMALGFALIPKLGIVGASLANIASIIFRNIFFIIVIYRRDKVITFYYPKLFKL